jgi:N-acetylglucosaminyldiphosphoundecaprenol N-acetyl-beta-D-mannosaminyltransferase
MRKNAGKLDAGVMAGLGGCLDVFAGSVERAPERMQKMGLEWLYRLYKEPSRIGRMAKLPGILFKSAGRRMRGRNNG